MVDQTSDEAEKPAKRSKLPLIMGLIFAIAGAAAGYLAASSGLLPFANTAAQNASKPPVEKTSPSIVYLEVDPLIVSLTGGEKLSHLRFRAQLEVQTQYAEEVSLLMPRIVDVLNTYLRAINEEDVMRPAALVRLRAQMLRRVQVVVGQDRVNDLLVMEFVVS